MKEFWSKRIRELTPYVPGEQPKERKFIKLNTNENPYGPSRKVLSAIQAETGDTLRLYPDPEGTALRNALSAAYGVPAEQIFVGNGSDEVLAMAFQAFFDEGSRVVFPDITYSFYTVYAALFGVQCDIVPLDEHFRVLPERLQGAQGVILANPNAPTGIELEQSGVESVLQANPNCVVIVDEAYVDFGGETALGLVDRYPNLLVVRTCSKSRSLAGLRVGWAFGSENLITALNCVKNSFNSYTLDRLAQVGAVAAVEDGAYFEACREKVIATRERTARGLEALGFSVCPSKTNFLFISHPTVAAKTLFDGLREKGILVRWFNQPRISNHLRVSIGTDGEMDAFLAAVTDLIAVT